MNLFCTRLSIMIKRTLKQPVYLIMLLFLPILTIIYIKLPESEQSTFIPVAVCCDDTGENAAEFMEDLRLCNSAFTFYFTEDEASLYTELASGRTSYGYYIPEGFFDAYTGGSRDVGITVYTTGAKGLSPVINEIIYSFIFKIYAAEEVKLKLHEVITDEEAFSSVSEAAEAVFDTYMESDNVFSLEDYSEGEYTESTMSHRIELPLRKLTALFIFAAALIMAGSFISDSEAGVYSACRMRAKLSFRAIEILSGILPVMLTGTVCLLLTEDTSLVSTVSHVALYSALVLIFSFAASLLFKKSTSYHRVLPAYLILTVIFSDIFFELSELSHEADIIGHLFLPYYF